MVRQYRIHCTHVGGARWSNRPTLIIPFDFGSWRSPWRTTARSQSRFMEILVEQRHWSSGSVGGFVVCFFSLKMHPLLLPKIHTKTQLFLSHLLFHHYSSLEYFQREKKTTYYFTVKKQLRMNNLTGSVDRIKRFELQLFIFLFFVYIFWSPETISSSGERLLTGQSKWTYWPGSVEISVVFL